VLPEGVAGECWGGAVLPDEGVTIGAGAGAGVEVESRVAEGEEAMLLVVVAPAASVSLGVLLNMLENQPDTVEVTESNTLGCGLTDSYAILLPNGFREGSSNDGKNEDSFFNAAALTRNWQPEL